MATKRLTTIFLMIFNLKNINFFYLDQIEDIFVANPDYLENLKKRGIKKDAILENSTLMLLDKHNMTRQYIDDYLQDNQITIAESGKSDHCQGFH